MNQAHLARLDRQGAALSDRKERKVSLGLLGKALLGLLVWLVLSVPVALRVSKVLKARREEMESEAAALLELQVLRDSQGQTARFPDPPVHRAPPYPGP